MGERIVQQAAKFEHVPIGKTMFIKHYSIILTVNFRLRLELNSAQALIALELGSFKKLTEKLSGIKNSLKFRTHHESSNETSLDRQSNLSMHEKSLIKNFPELRQIFERKVLDSKLDLRLKSERAHSE